MPKFSSSSLINLIKCLIWFLMYLFLVIAHMNVIHNGLDCYPIDNSKFELLDPLNSNQIIPFNNFNRLFFYNNNYNNNINFSQRFIIPHVNDNVQIKMSRSKDQSSRLNELRRRSRRSLLAKYQSRSRIVATVYDPHQKRYLDPYEIDRNNNRNELEDFRLSQINQFRPANFHSSTAIDYYFNRNNRLTRATSSNRRHQGGRHRVYCPGQDVATRAFRAPTVFAGKVRSMSSNKKPNYAVTFEVKVIYKNQSKFRPLVKNETIRLHFAHGRGTTVNCECLDGVSNSSSVMTTADGGGADMAASNHCGAGGLIRAHLRPGKTYILFVNRIGAHNYTILGPPVASTNKSVHSVLRVLQTPHSVKPANVSELNDVTLRMGKKLKLICRTQGFPPPRISWLKNGTDQFLRLKRVRIQHRRRQSTLIISKVKSEDAGRYECTARGVIGPPITKSAFVKVLNNTRNENTSSADPHPCTEDRAQICMNGGTCMFFSSIGEYACQCANGFNGRRCDQKMPLITKTDEDKMLIYTPTKLLPGF